MAKLGILVHRDRPFRFVVTDGGVPKVPLVSTNGQAIGGRVIALLQELREKIAPVETDQPVL